MNKHTPPVRKTDYRMLPIVTLALMFLMVLPFTAEGAFTNCTDQPDQCCYGFHKYSSGVCSSRGTCYNTKCFCFSSYEGDNCEFIRSCGTGRCDVTCSGHGTCAINSGQCVCDPGYGGECCSSAVSSDVVLTPATLAFGQVTVGATSQTRTATITSPVSNVIVSVAPGGDNATDFSLGGTCAEGGSLSAGGSCTVIATFTPSAAGSRSATLTVKTGRAVRYQASSVSGGPVVTTATATDITQTTATANATITSLGSYTVSRHGVCWGTITLPTIEYYYLPDNCVDLGAVPATGSFTASITGLSADTTYYIRPYAVSVNKVSGVVHQYSGYGPSVSLHTASASAAGSSPAIDVTLTSTLTGTGVISADSIVIDPVTSTTLYAGLNGAGVYKSVNSGTNWAKTAGQPGNTNIKALVINKGDTKILYAGTYGGGVYRTADAGASWSACGALSNVNVVSLAIDGNGKVYAGTEAGVYVSGDSCATWSALNTGLPQ